MDGVHIRLMFSHTQSRTSGGWKTRMVCKKRRAGVDLGSAVYIMKESRGKSRIQFRDYVQYMAVL
jgi:hypothetical protein